MMSRSALSAATHLQRNFKVGSKMMASSLFFPVSTCGRSSHFTKNLFGKVATRSIVTPIPMTEATESRAASSRKISTKLLCDISGTRYYESNEEIDFGASQNVNVFDENNVNIGIISFQEAHELAKSLGKDVVLRNKGTDPPVVKIMDYKVELIKRVFKKLGREVKGSEKKPKTIQMSSDISMHDLEFRKRRAIEFLK